MQDTHANPLPQGAEEDVSLRRFFLLALLWLPMMFFLWFAMRSPVVFPVTRSVKAIIEAWLPGLVTDVGQDFHNITYAFQAVLDGSGGLPSGILEMGLEVNVLMYCYGLPLLFGLIMATPLNWRRTFLQMTVGYLILLPMQVFGVLGNILMDISFKDFGAAVAAELAAAGYTVDPGLAARSVSSHVHARLAEQGLTLDLVALMYQFGYLILPAVVPIAVWIAFNRRFLEGLLRRPEPSVTADGRSEGRSSDSDSPPSSP